MDPASINVLSNLSFTNSDSVSTIGIRASKTSPQFLHANSTSHSWPFSAIAELIDNAYDPDVRAKKLEIDVEDLQGIKCLTFTDNGLGMTPEALHKMLSFGFSDKQALASSGHAPIGRYGNGFKSGSMRLGRSALVLSKRAGLLSVGLLSQSYLAAIGAETVLVPIVVLRLPDLELVGDADAPAVGDNVAHVLRYSRVCPTLDELRRQARRICGVESGTRIIISELKTCEDGHFELDLNSVPDDILFSEREALSSVAVVGQQKTVDVREQQTSPYHQSLRAYCSILFLKPRLQIFLRRKKVKTMLMAQSLSRTERDSYTPTCLGRPTAITFGFGRSQHDYGILMYHNNRLIKAFEKVGIQRQANELGVRVVGVCELNFLEPIHNKQDFSKTDRYNSCVTALGQKLNEYWFTKTEGGVPPPLVNDWTWAQCDSCLKWRRLPPGTASDSLPDSWYCYMNSDRARNRCEIEEELEDAGEARVTYKKTGRPQRVGKKRRNPELLPEEPVEQQLDDGIYEIKPSVRELVEARRTLARLKRQERYHQLRNARLTQQMDFLLQKSSGAAQTSTAADAAAANGADPPVSDAADTSTSSSPFRCRVKSSRKEVEIADDEDNDIIMMMSDEEVEQVGRKSAPILSCQQMPATDDRNTQTDPPLESLAFTQTPALERTERVCQTDPSELSGVSRGCQTVEGPRVREALRSLRENMRTLFTLIFDSNHPCMDSLLSVNLDLDPEYIDRTVLKLIDVVGRESQPDQ